MLHHRILRFFFEISYSVLIFNSMLFDGIFQIYPHVYVFGFFYSCQHVQLFIILFISGPTNVFHSFQVILHYQEKQKNSRKNQLFYVKKNEIFSLIFISL